MSARVLRWSAAAFVAAAGVLAYSIAVRARAPRFAEASTVGASDRPPTRADIVDGSFGRDELAESETSERALVASTAPYFVLVTDEAGHELASAFVQWMDRNKPLATVETDSSGHAGFAPAPTSLDSTTSHLLVSCAGYGPRVTRVEHGHASPNNAQSVALAKGSALKLRIVAPDGGPVERADVRVSVSFVKLGDASLASEQRGLGSNRGRDWMTGVDVTRFGGLGSREWLGLSDADGRVAFDDLPRELGLVVDVVAGGVAYPGLARLRVGRDAAELDRTLTLPALAHIRGRVVERGGAPIANAKVWLVAADEPTPARFLSMSDSRVLDASTNGDGAFAFELVTVGKWFVGLAPEVERGVPLTEFAPVATLVVLEPQGRDDVEIVVDRGLFLRGFVVDEHEAPVAGANLIAVADDGAGMLRAQSGNDGAFVLGPMQRGALTILASKTGCACSGEPTHVTTEDANVLVVLRPAGALVVDCERAIDGARASIEELILVDKAGASRYAHPTRASLSSLTLDGVAAGSYHLVVRTFDGEVAVVDGIEFGGGASQQRVVARAAPAARVALENASLSTTLELRVLDRDGRELDASRVAAGDVIEITLPPGPATIERYSRVGVDETRSIELSSGESVAFSFAATP